jgi:hypothetical protein
VGRTSKAPPTRRCSPVSASPPWSADSKSDAGIAVRRWRPRRHVAGGPWNGSWNELLAPTETGGSQNDPKPKQSTPEKPALPALAGFARGGLTVQVPSSRQIRSLHGLVWAATGICALTAIKLGPRPSRRVSGRRALRVARSRPIAEYGVPIRRLKRPIAASVWALVRGRICSVDWLISQLGRWQANRGGGKPAPAACCPPRECCPPRGFWQTYHLSPGRCPQSGIVGTQALR